MTNDPAGYDTSAVSFDRDQYREEHTLPPQTDTVSELIEVLELIREEHGDIPVENHYLGLSVSPYVEGSSRVRL